MSVAASCALMLQLGLLSAEPAALPSAPRPTLTESQLQADEPPGMQSDPHALSDSSQLPEPPSVDPALISTLGRTVVALVFVVVLIYLCARLLPRFFKQFPMPGRGTQQLRVLERTMLDAKHSVVLLQVDDNTRLLLGTGEGVQLLTTLTPLSGPSVPFRASMNEAQREPKVS